MSLPQMERAVVVASIPLLGRLLKLRYLLFGSAVGGGYAIHNKYNEIKNALPDVFWIHDILPEDVVSKVSESYSNILSSISAIDLGKYRHNAALKQSEQLSADKVFNMEVIQKELSQLKSREDRLISEMNSIQSKYQVEVERLEGENQGLRRQLMLLKTRQKSDALIIKKSLIDMYSDVLDELSDFDSSYRVHDQLPRVVVVGDQSSGKTSVLEMITQARIFPRGAGEMMTRSPVKVTLSNGPYHVAQLKNSSREYDLTSETERKELRDEIEVQMRNAVKAGETITNKVISLNVKGPGLQRMVLIDLPGIISTETQGMASNTRQSIFNLARNHMSNPNAIILCIQDGSIDAERSNVTDLVSSIDPSGKRTIFVLTKVDAAETAQLRPDRLKRILDGRLFPMKALGYFAVVTGTGNPEESIDAINKHERNFFQNSQLVKDGVFKTSQITTRNLSMALDAYTATRYNLESEWRNNFRGMAQQSREDLFNRARYELLDQLSSLGNTHPDKWEKVLLKRMWTELRPTFLDDVLIKAYERGNRPGFNTTVDINLARIVDGVLPKTCVNIARDTLLATFEEIIADNRGRKEHDPILNQMERAVLDQVHKRFHWDSKAVNSLHVIQVSLLEDHTVPDRTAWDHTLSVMNDALREQHLVLSTQLQDKFGYSYFQQWLKWKSAPSAVQVRDKLIFKELVRLLQSKSSLQLYEGDIMTVKNNVKLVAANAELADDIKKEHVQAMWQLAYRSFFLENCRKICSACHEFFSFYKQGFTDQGLDCKEVEFFWRVNRILEGTASALRLQISSVEARRFERNLREVLEQVSEDEKFKCEHIVGRRVDLAERLIKVRSIQQHLEEFISSLNDEKSSA